MKILGKRGFGGVGGIIAAALGVMIVVIVMFSVVLPQVNTSLYGAQATQSNLSGGAASLAQQAPLLLVLGFIFIPIVAVALGYFGSRQ